MSVSKNKFRGGFTLVELILVMVILAVAVGMVLPYLNSLGDLKVTAAARILTADLQYAQNLAITRQEPITVSFDLVGESYSLSDASGVLIHPINKKAYTVNFTAMPRFEEMNIVSSNFAGNTLVSFDEFGAPNSSGSVTLQAGGYTYRVDVASATGKVTVTPVGS